MGIDFSYITKINTGATIPLNPLEGEGYYDSRTGEMLVYRKGAWESVSLTNTISSIEYSCGFVTAYGGPGVRETKTRLRCEYCGCISGKEYGTCEHCGAPLVREDIWM